MRKWVRIDDEKASEFVEIKSGINVAVSMCNLSVYLHIDGRKRFYIAKYDCPEEAQKALVMYAKEIEDFFRGFRSSVGLQVFG